MKKRVTCLLDWATRLVLLVGLVCSALGQPGSQTSPARTARESAELREARQLSEQANRLFAQNKFDEALSHATRSLAIRERILGPNDPAVAVNLSSAAEVYQMKGDYERAEPLHLRALSIFEKSLGSHNQWVARSLNSLGLLYNGKGDQRKAESMFQRALTLYEKMLGRDHLHVSAVLNNLGDVYSSAGSFDKAQPLYQRALSIREAALGKGDPQVATSLFNLARIHKAKGDYTQAEPLARRALTIRETALGPDHSDVADSLNLLGAIYDAKGDYSRAEPLYQRALAIREKMHGQDQSDIGTSLNNLAGVYAAKGDYDRAEALYERAFALCEKMFGPEHPRLALALNNLGLLYYRRSYYKTAEPLLQRALAIREKALGPEHPDVADSLNALGLVYYDRGDNGRAEPLFRRALVIRETALPREHPSIAISLNNLARLYNDKRDFPRAEPLFQRALTIYMKTGGPEHPDVAQVLSSVALMYAASGDSGRAVDYLARGLDIEEGHLASILATGSEDQKQAYAAKLSDTTSLVVSLHLREAFASPQAARLALTTLLRRKGRVLDALAESLQTLRRLARPEDQALLEKLAATRARLSGKVLKPGEKPEDPPRNVWAAFDEMPRREEINKIKEEVRQLEAELSTRSVASSKPAPPITLEMIQSLIPEGAALVELALYDTYNFKPTKPQEKWGTARYAAYVLRRQGPPRWADLGESSTVDNEVKALRAALKNPRRSDVRQPARALDERVMAPVRKLLGNARTLLVSPDGTLSLVPFGAFVDEQSRYLVESYSLSYLTTGRDLLRLQARAVSRRGPLVIANPDFDDDGSANPSRTSAAHSTPGNRSVNLAGFAFDPLPGTAREAEALKGILRGATVLTGSKASEAALKLVPGPSILHIATHGFFLTDVRKERQEGAYRALFNSDPSGRKLMGENPLLRSGLALAGFNKGKSGTEDGVLTALEASGLDLTGTKLVVLSACETGVGDVLNGEGVYGLRRALVIAGAESQVMSLWQVNDESTRDLMIAYYKGLMSAGGRSESLRNVQLDMLRSKDRQHPFYWASFIASGDWRSMR